MLHTMVFKGRFLCNLNKYFYLTGKILKIRIENGLGRKKRV